jgi:predicted ATP-grasp superfamily ATP-dependent carboligase
MEPVALIGFAEALAAPETAWSLVDAGFTVHVLARRGRRAALRHSAEVVVHEVCAPEDDFAGTLADIVRVVSAVSHAACPSCVLVPLDDAAVWLFEQIDLPASWTLLGPKGAQVELALSKQSQIAAACQAEIAVPPTAVALTSADVVAHARELPIVLKSADAVVQRAGKLKKGRTWICATRSELERAISVWAEDRPLLIQPFIRGTGEGVFGLATSDGVHAWSAHRRLRMMNPHGSGSSACVSQQVPAEIQPGIERLIRRTGWCGLFMVELMRDERGLLWFVEFNGRTWGSMALSRRQGLEYPAWAAEAALGRTPGPWNRPIDTRVICQNAGRELLHLLFVLRGPQTDALRDWPSFWGTAYDIIRTAATSRLYNMRRTDRSVFLYDVWYTVSDQLFKRRLLHSTQA